MMGLYTRPGFSLTCLLIYRSFSDSRLPRFKQRGDNEEANPLAPPDRNKNRTRVPQAMPRSYEIAPASRVVQGHNAYARPIGAAGDDIIRRMKAKKQAANKGKKSGMIIG